MTKAELRKTYISRQKDLSPADRAEKSRAIAGQFFQHFDLSRTRFIHCFIPIEKFNEIDTKFIFERLWSGHPRTEAVVPRVDFETNEIRNLRFDPTTELKRNTWHIDEPEHDEFVESDKIDIVLVPGSCFDLEGHRVGYGKGFYDRFLKTCRPDCLKIGLSYFEPVEAIDDIHDGDVALDFVITPERVIKLRP